MVFCVNYVIFMCKYAIICFHYLQLIYGLTNCMIADRPFKLDQCLIKPREYSIEFENGEIKVMQPKYIDVLNYLASQYPRIVERQELIDNIWDGNHYVGEKSLNNSVWNLRNELKHTGVTYIETIRKKGYRLLIQPHYLEAETALAKSTVLSHKHLKLASYITAAVVIFSVMIWIYLSQINAQDQTQISSITSEPGREVYPVISPDKKYVIYSWRRIGKQPNLYLKNLHDKSKSAKQLTFSNDYEGRVVWGPKGEYVYFQRKHWDYASCEIIRLNIITTKQKTIAPCIGEVDFSLAISPDGNRLAYIYSDENSTKRRLHFLDVDTQKAPYPAYDCKESCRYDDLDSAFSPDGKSLIISRSLDKGLNEDLFLFDLTSQSFKQLTQNEGDIKGFTWHPKNDRIIYSTQFAGHRDGFILNLKNNTRTKMSIPGFSYPNFIPKTKDIIYHDRQVSSLLSSFEISDEMASAPFPFIQSNYSYHSPHYSKIMNKVVFVSNESGFEEIWTSNIDGSDRQQLTSMKSHLAYPRWSHNGEYIAFLGPKTLGKSNELYILNVKSQVVKTIKSEFEQHFRPSWQHDDLALIAGALDNHKPALYAFGINNQTPKKILDKQASFAIEDNDGNIYYSPSRNSGLWLFNPDNNHTKQVINNDLFRVKYNWELSDEGIYFQHDYTDHHQINYFDLQNKKIDAVLKLPKGTIQRQTSLTLIKDKDTKKIIFTQLEFPNVDVKRLSHPKLK